MYIKFILKRYLFITFISCVSAFVYGQNNNSVGFTTDSMQIGVNKFRYGLLEPDNIESGNKYPLVLALHGTEWWWTPIHSYTPYQLWENLLSGEWPFPLAECWTQANIRKRYPTYVLVPHIHDELSIKNDDGSSWFMDEVLEFLDSVMTKTLLAEQIDINRIYVTGHSMGGYATYISPFYLANKVAAIAPMSGWSSDYLLNKIEDGKYKNTSIWNFHHGKDIGTPSKIKKITNKLEETEHNIVRTQTYIDSVYTMSAAEIQHKINTRHCFLTTEYNYGKTRCANHWAMDFASTDTLFFNWLFDQYLIDEDATKITKLSSEDYNLSWTVKNPSDTVEIWYREDNDWQMVTKGVFTQNQIVLTDYLEESKLQQGFIRVASINPEGFMYGKDERKINASTASVFEQNTHEIKIYPNTAKDFLFVENLLKSTVVQIYNLHGVLMKTDKINNNCLYIGDLPMGSYIIKVGSVRQIIRVE